MIDYARSKGVDLSRPALGVTPVTGIAW